MATPDNFRSNLRASIDARETTQRDVAARANVSYPYLNRILRGKTQPTLPQCERIAAAIGVPLLHLLDSPKKFKKYLLTTVSR